MKQMINKVNDKPMMKYTNNLTKQLKKMEVFIYIIYI